MLRKEFLEEPLLLFLLQPRTRVLLDFKHRFLSVRHLYLQVLKRASKVEPR